MASSFVYFWQRHQIKCIIFTVDDYHHQVNRNLVSVEDLAPLLLAWINFFMSFLLHIVVPNNVDSVSNLCIREKRVHTLWTNHYYQHMSWMWRIVILNLDYQDIISLITTFCRFVLFCFVFSQWNSIVIKLKNNVQTHNVTLTLMNLFGGNLFRTYQYCIFCR